MEPTRESVDRWTATLDEIAAATLVPEGSTVHSWISGQNVPGKALATYFFLGGVPMYTGFITAEADAGFAGFSFASREGRAASG